MVFYLRRRVTFANVTALMALVIAMGGFAVAAIPSPGGVITGCFQKKSGQLRIVAASGKCGRSERRISWSKEGARGTPGVQGIQGSQGVPGTPGSDAQFNGAAAGGSLTGTYPNPLIAPNAVGQPEIATNGVASPEVQDGSLAMADLARVRGTVAHDPPSVAANTCVADSVALSGAIGGDPASVWPSSNFGDHSLVLQQERTAVADKVTFTICNPTTAIQDAPSGTWVVATFKP